MSNFGEIETVVTKMKGNETIKTPYGKAYLKDLSDKEVKKYAESVMQEILRAHREPIKR